MPEARTLSTGTVYVSTGVLSLVDNEAQLAYILGHEIAHVEKEHWRQDILVAQYIEDSTRSAEKKAAIVGAVAGGVLGVFGGGNKAQNVAVGALVGTAASKYLVKIFDRKAFEWSAAQEDECDKLALQYMLDRNYDVREAPAFYETLKAAAIEDPRIELDKFADRKRSEERRKTVDGIIRLANTDTLARTLVGATNLRGKSLSIDRNLPVVISRIQRNQAKMSDQITARLASGEILAGDGEFENIMSALKRDNGISAFYYDMYKLSERNLSQALAIRSDDPLGYFYYGKVIKLTARKPGEREKALQMFARAIELDKRNVLPHSRLYLALTKMGGRTTNNIDEIVGDLKDYVTQYQRLNGGQLPPNMNVIYDYMQEAGDVNWNATVYMNVRGMEAPTVTRPVQVDPAPAKPTRKQ
jgi:tetratricopeptide (TPR) repeat protein